MLKTNLPPMRPDLIVCPFCECRNRIGVHSYKQRRYKCHTCGKTFAETVGTPLYGVKYPAWIVILVLALLAAGCPVQAIVFAFGIDERTISDWQAKAGQHAKRIQEQVVCQSQVDLGQVQADELYVKMQGAKVWMATAMSVFSRLFLWGAVAAHRDESLTKGHLGDCPDHPTRAGSGATPSADPLRGRWAACLCHRHPESLP
jgi:transposase-like protein